ncbi:hypothetical protein IE077_001939, partial [Cardiosporidium cionae]
EESGKTERITLDCANMAEFERWNVALTFGGFIKDDKAGPGVKSTYANLAKYVFPVNLFDEKGEERRSALEIVNGQVLLYVSPEASTPTLRINSSECEVQTFIEQRKIRIYINRYSLKEERLDLIVLLAKDFDRLKKLLEEQEFKEVTEARRVSKSLKPLVHVP